MKLLIVESKGKIQKLESILGPEWKVTACFGHVRDMPAKSLGFETSTFEPEYEVTERGRGVLGRLQGLVKSADEIYLATDPDREGEAIAWHLRQCLKLKNYKRVTFSEITAGAVKAALANPRQIDIPLVDAQKARRVLDRAYGYLTSGPLSRASGCKSAGRVQTPAVCLIVERERARAAFKVMTHFGAALSFEAVDNISNGWQAQWVVKDWLTDGQEYFLDKETALKIASLRTLTVQNCQISESRKAPPAPFSTSAMQQAAKRVLKISVKKTMQLAQDLYESGHITYMRTDSVNLSDEAQEMIRRYCLEQEWPVVAAPRAWKAKEGAQEAHECIRPTHIEVETAGETPDHQKLYALIRLRALATQLDDAVYSVRTLTLTGEVEGRTAHFEARGRALTSPGWRLVSAQAEPEDDQEETLPVPSLKAGCQVTAVAGKLVTRITQPPSRFDEASLVRDLERLGIGRPSTYATIIDSIKTRGYVTEQKDEFIPTPLGNTLYEAVKGKFEFVEYDTTKMLEHSLDDIVARKITYKEVMQGAYVKLRNEIDAFERSTGKICPECGKPLRRVTKPPSGKYRGYDFWGCTGYPECKYTL